MNNSNLLNQLLFSLVSNHVIAFVIKGNDLALDNKLLKIIVTECLWTKQMDHFYWNFAIIISKYRVEDDQNLNIYSIEEEKNKVACSLFLNPWCSSGNRVFKESPISFLISLLYFSLFQRKQKCNGFPMRLKCRTRKLERNKSWFLLFH